MADPFSVLAGAVGVADVAVKTSSKLRRLVSEFKDAPALILALSNEVTEISLVLRRVNESRKAVGSLGDSQHDAAFLAALDGQLNNAQAIITELESLTATLSAGNSLAEKFRWLRKKKHAANLKGRLKSVRERINELLVAHNPSLESRIKLEVHEVRIGTEKAQAETQAAFQTANSNIHATSSKLVAIRDIMDHQHTVISSKVQTVRDTMSLQTAEAASHRQEVSDQLANIQAEQTRQSEATQNFQMAIIKSFAARSNTSMATRQAGPAIRPVPSRDNFNSVVFFSLRLPGSHCANGCRCKCHLPATPDMSLRIPPIPRAAVGYLFLRYTGYPWSSARCDVESCTEGKHTRFQATYCFPLWLCQRYVMHASVEASMSGIFTFTLVAKRRMPWKRGSLFYEAAYGTAKTVEHVLRQANESIGDIYYQNGSSALDFALKNETPEKIAIIKLLLQNGADLDHEDDNGVSFRLRISHALLALGQLGYVYGLEEVLPFSTCIEGLDMSYIHEIVLGIVPLSLAQALQNSVVHELNVKDRLGSTPLIYAANHGNAVAVRALIDAGAEVNEVDLHGRIALHGAIYCGEGGSLDCVDALLQAGSDCNASVLDGFSCLHLAAEKNHVAITRRLIHAGANIQAQTCYGQTPMWRAAYSNAVDTIHCLYEAGASAELADLEGATPLFTAIQYGRREAAILLLRLGANAAHVTWGKRTLLHYSARFLSFETVQALTDVGVRGLDATVQDQDGLTAQQFLELRKPGPGMRAAFEHLVQVWCRPEEVGDSTSDEEDCFHDAVEY